VTLKGVITRINPRESEGLYQTTDIKVIIGTAELGTYYPTEADRIPIPPGWSNPRGQDHRHHQLPRRQPSPTHPNSEAPIMGVSIELDAIFGTTESQLASTGTCRSGEHCDRPARSRPCLERRFSNSWEIRRHPSVRGGAISRLQPHTIRSPLSGNGQRAIAGQVLKDTITNIAKFPTVALDA
jgi:hypothetical protein